MSPHVTFYLTGQQTIGRVSGVSQVSRDSITVISTIQLNQPCGCLVGCIAVKFAGRSPLTGIAVFLVVGIDVVTVIVPRRIGVPKRIVQNERIAI